MINKCLNRITTETEISASHVSHFILGNLDNKTSHKFISLNLHSALAWLSSEIKKYDIEEAFSLDEDISNENSVKEITKDKVIEKNKDDNDDDSDDDDDEDNITYKLNKGDNGLVFVNQLLDYINRGEGLEHMNLYEYRSKVYKEKYTDEKLEKLMKRKETKRETEQMHLFTEKHPQSKTHWQKVRTMNNTLVPSLSKLPPSCNRSKLRFQKCILLLFKPFTCFRDLYNGKSWDETYDEFYDTTENKRYIENIQELHVGIEEKDDEKNEDDEDVVDELDENENEDDNITCNDNDEELDPKTTEALDVIRKTHWLDESVSNHKSIDKTPMFENNERLPEAELWKEEMKKQNLNKNEQIKQPGDLEPIPIEYMTIDDNVNDSDIDIEFSVEQISISDTEGERDNVLRLRNTISCNFTLNTKQKKAFETATDNLIKRHFQEETEQILFYVGGPGGTGKSQVIKAIVEFYKIMKKEHTLKLSANTGTAAKHIGGSTTTTLFGFSSNANAKLQKRFESVNTIIIDEISMIGCSQLLKISKALSKGKCTDPSIPFGKVDMIFFGDFIQFPPVKDTPLYCSWNNEKGKSNSRQAGINKQLGSHLWRQINKIVFLDEQMRCTDKEYLGLLNRLREGKCNDNDVEMLRRRVVGQSFDITSALDAPIITPGNQLVTAINDLFVDSLSKSTPVYISKSRDYMGRKSNQKEIPTRVEKIVKKLPTTSTRGLPRELKLYIGMPIIVTSNIATELGITNGTTGIIRFIPTRNSEALPTNPGYHYLETTPEYVIVELDDIKMNQLYGLPPNHVPIMLKTESFQVIMPGKQKNVSVNRSHFPIVPRFSCTAHKSQGQTLRKAIIDLVPRTGSAKGLGIEFAYVPLSRVRRLQDLTILRPFDSSVLKAKVKDGCTAMMEEFKSKDLCKDL